MREQLEIIEQGVETWNEWRETNPNVRPNLRGADLRGASLQLADLSRAYLRGTSLRGVDLRLANLSRTDLREADLSEARLYGVDLRGANLRLTNLREADLRGARLYEADLRGADLNGADLRGAHLRLTNLRETDLREADLRGANLRGANLYGANLRRANLYGADLRGVSLVKTNLKGADITRCAVYGVSVWNIELDKETIVKDLIITADGEPIVMVDDLEVAQFVYLLLNHDKLRNVLDAVIEKGVLILGRFGGGELEVLRAMADRLRDLDYTPIIFDFERPRDHDYTETIMTLVGMVRFVIADLSGPSVPKELYATVTHTKRPFVPILETGYKQYSLFTDLLENQNVFEPVEFESQEQLLALLPERIVAPAEAYVENKDKSGLG
jgi:uncharacterized protein YjbI with pentapeptide repeats